MAHRSADWRTPTAVLFAGGLILTLAMGIRHGFGLFLQPISADLGWGRETFALGRIVRGMGGMQGRGRQDESQRQRSHRVRPCEGAAAGLSHRAIPRCSEWR